MNTENTKAQMRKGILEFCILSLINNKEMYVSDLIDELKKRKARCSRRNSLSATYKIEKWRISCLQMGRIYQWTAKKILPNY